MRPDLARRAEADILMSRQVVSVNVHSHRATCAKPTGGEPSDINCRMAYPRPIQQQTTQDEATGAIFLQRQSRRLVPFNRTLMLAQSANMSCDLLCDSGRWTHAVTRAAAMQHPLPPLPSLEQGAYEAGEYACSYSTKPQNQNTNEALLETIARARRAEERAAEDAGGAPSAMSVSRRRVAQLANASAQTTSYPATLAALYLLGNVDYVMSHRFRAFSITLFRQQWLPSVQATEQTAGATIEIELPSVTSSTAQPVTAAVDYLLRGDALEDMCPYVMTAMCEKVPVWRGKCGLQKQCTIRSCNT